MTDLECSKICKVLGVTKLFLNTDGMMCAIYDDLSFGHLYIYEESFSSALPLRILVIGSRQPSTKKLLEYLFKQAADGISTMVVKPTKSGTLDKSKFMIKDDTLESFLVEHDLKFTKRRSLRRELE